MANNVVETCSCGAKIDGTFNFSADAVTALEGFRRAHASCRSANSNRLPLAADDVRGKQNK